MWFRSKLARDRSIFAGKRYLPVGLVEAGRGCHFRCEFCAIQSYFGNTQTRRPIDEILEEVRRVKKPLIFFVDDNITSNLAQAKEFFRALIPLGIRWVGQSSINAAHDEEFLDLLGATNMIPGPNSTEMAIHIGYSRGGVPGLIVAGVCFIVPAALIVLAIAVGYVQFGTLPHELVKKSTDLFANEVIPHFRGKADKQPAKAKSA